jgi:hypothetical protein
MFSHGKDIRSVKRVIEEMNPNDKVFVDTGRHANDDIRKKKIYAGWGSSGMVSITLFHKAALNTYLRQKLEWRTWKDWWAQIVGVEECCGLKQLHPPGKSSTE